MSKGRRYKNKRKTKGSHKVFIAIIIIFTIIILNKNKKEESVNSVESIDNEINTYIEEEEIIETVSNEVSIIEPTEDEGIKTFVEDLIAEKRLNENNFSLFYYNVDLKKYYFYNEETYFTGASTIKMPIAMLYYDKIQNNELSLEDTITYTSDCYEAGAGTTAYTYSVNSKVPISFLLEQSIVNSDNTAINILIKNLGYKNCKQQIAKYSSTEISENFYSSNIINARYAYDVVNHLYENMDNYSELISYLKKSSDGEYLKKYIEDYDVAHKYGSYNGYVHDYGIVFGKTTYLVGIFTKNISSADEFIADTSLKILNKVNENS